MGMLRDTQSAVSYPTLDPFEICDDVMIEPPAGSPVSMMTVSPAGDLSKIKDLRSATIQKNRQNKVSAPPSPTSLIIRTRAVGRYIFFCLLAAGAVTLVGKVKPWSYFSQPNLVFAYFEVRALDANGHPIAGAVVKNAGKRVGTTDSFGEWRRYMQVPLGATVPISLTKKNQSQVLFVSKNFAVPPVKQEKSDIELRSSVQLVPADPTSIDSDNDGVSNPIDLANVKIGQPSESLPKITHQLGDGSTKPEMNRPEGIRNETYQAPQGLQVGTADVTVDLDSIWFSSTDAGIEKELLPAIVKRAKELGLKVEKDAAWRVNLSNIIDKPAKIAKDGGGLILVGSVISSPSQNHSVEFLRNYQVDARTTARGILFGLMNHVNKNVLLTKVQGRWAAVQPKTSPQIWRLSPNQIVLASSRSIKLSAERYRDETFEGFYIKDQKDAPCASSSASCQAHTPSFLEIPPVSGWSRLRLTVPGLSKDPVKVFVSGYPAKSVGENVFEYWGQERGTANATILRNGRLLHRGPVGARASVAAAEGTRRLSRQ